jgi:hypothetical protein
LAKPQQAHEYMYKALLLARKLKHLVVENVALLSLNNLHWTITKTIGVLIIQKSRQHLAVIIFFQSKNVAVF